MNSNSKAFTCADALPDGGVARLDDNRERGDLALPGKTTPLEQSESCANVLSLDVSEDLPRRNWAKMMDCTRAKFGHDDQVPNGRCRTYYRFTLSPSPDAGCSLDSLRAYVKAWAEENFRSNGDLHEYAIVCQNYEGSLHASVIVNATNKETGKKLRIWRRGSVDLNMSARELGKEFGIGPVDLGVESFHETVQKNPLALASSPKDSRGKERRSKRTSPPKRYGTVSIRMKSSEADALDAAAAAAGITRAEYIRARLDEGQGDPQGSLFWVPDMACVLNSHVDVLRRFVDVNSSVQKMLVKEIDALEESGEEDPGKLRDALHESEMLEDQALEMMNESLEELGRIKSLLKVD